ncbi:MAG TPA: bifunctional UDP-N-acetylglucosamine diphosphorylase/glucosamine-1-phosphate N-acetyltransferase GlmU [Terriglobia bacterium]|nr:bifunctional UDP-N-acetylglucosamine diphosphorylase/glucosamine-1-phosphate N-acetyltransferase GlmU [Terriglobia bacterium]
MDKQDFSIVILAAGKSTRFKSKRSKLLHALAGRPLGDYVVRTSLAAGAEKVLMIVGHDAAAVRKTLGRPGVEFVEQKEQLGTGHALMIARPQLEKCSGSTVVVVVGDAPLLRAETLLKLVAAHQKARAAASVLTMQLDDPRGYGRIVRSSGKRVRAIVEEKLCTPAQRKIKEVSSGTLCFSRKELLKDLDKLSDKNIQKEYLLTDLVKIFNQRRKKVIAFPVEDAREVLGVNDRVELAHVEHILRIRKAESLMRDGVTIVDPQTTYIDANVEVGQDTLIEPGVCLLGNTRIGRDCTIRAHSMLTDSTLGDEVLVQPCTVVTGCQVGPGVVLGPFAHLREGARIDREAQIGNFVEVKKSKVGSGTKARHLTYLGDATLGEHVNIGAGTVTCNYDGEKKNPTNIEDGVFIGSGSMLVAPVRIGKGAYVAAGSVITEDVPPEALAVGRARQVNKEGWVRKHKERRSQSVSEQPRENSDSNPNRPAER